MSEGYQHSTFLSRDCALIECPPVICTNYLSIYLSNSHNQIISHGDKLRGERRKRKTTSSSAIHPSNCNCLISANKLYFLQFQQHHTLFINSKSINSISNKNGRSKVRHGLNLHTDADLYSVAINCHIQFQFNGARTKNCGNTWGLPNDRNTAFSTRTRT